MMNLDVQKAYRLRSSWWLFDPLVVIGVHERTINEGLPTETKGVFYSTCAPVYSQGGHMIRPSEMTAAEGDEGSVRLVDAANRDKDDNSVVWTFEPLTLRRWLDMRDTWPDVEQLEGRITSDAALQSYYRLRYLSADLLAELGEEMEPIVAIV